MTRFISSVRRFRDSDDIPALVLWIVTLSTISIFLKILLVQEVYHEGFMAAADVAMASESPFVLRLMVPAVFAWDVLEAVLLAGGVYLLSRAIPQIDYNRAMLVAALLFLALATANYLSFRELHTGITLKSLGITTAWTFANPESAMPYLRKKYLLAAAAGILWASYPYLVVRYMAASRRRPTLRLRCLGGLLWAGPFLVVAGILPTFQTDFVLQWWWLILAPAALLFLFGGLSVGRKPPPLRSARGMGWALSLGVIVCISVGYAMAGTATFARTPFFFQGQYEMVAESIAQEDEAMVEEAVVPQSREALLAQYRSLAFPAGLASRRGADETLFAETPRPRHILFVSLETAPAALYPIADNDAFPTFKRMSAAGIVGTKHHTTASETFEAAYSMITGLYPAFGTKYDFIVPDSLPTILGAAGYQTTYIDSYELDWAPGKQPARMLQTVNFRTLLERADAPVSPEGTDPYEEKLAIERWAFDEAGARIIDAGERGQKSLVFVQTALGHHPWPARAADEDKSAQEKLHIITQDLEQLMAGLLERLEAAGLGKEVIVVVTGDHGFRIRGEFASVGLRVALDEMAFNVPLIIYAPGLLAKPVHVESFSSHIDLTPTLLELVGLPADGHLFHGMSLLDDRLASRVTFMMNETTMPKNGYHWNGYYFTADNLTRLATMSRDFTASETADASETLSVESEVPAQLAEPYGLVMAAKATIRSTHLFLRDLLLQEGESQDCQPAAPSPSCHRELLRNLGS